MQRRACGLKPFTGGDQGSRAYPRPDRGSCCGNCFRRNPLTIRRRRSPDNYSDSAPVAKEDGTLGLIAGMDTEGVAVASGITASPCLQAEAFLSTQAILCPGYQSGV